MRKSYSSSFKARVARAAIQEDRTLSELSAEFDVPQTVISKWKSQALDNIERAFLKSSATGSGLVEKSLRREVSVLREKIGELTIERDFLSSASVRLRGGGSRRW